MIIFKQKSPSGPVNLQAKKLNYFLGSDKSYTCFQCKCIGDIFWHAM